MANNGYLIEGVCLTPSSAIGSICSVDPSCTIGLVYTLKDGSPQKIVVHGPYGYWSIVPGFSSYDCEIPGPPLTEPQQIEAINGLFPHAVAILAIAWGLRYIRVLVAEWLKERNASD